MGLFRGNRITNFQANISVLSLNVDFRKIGSHTDDNIKHGKLCRYFRIRVITSQGSAHVTYINSVEFKICNNSLVLRT